MITSLLQGRRCSARRRSPLLQEVSVPQVEVVPVLKWRVNSASVPGSSHIERMRGSDDYCMVSVHDEYLVAVLADGMGSAHFSNVGSRLATKAAHTALVAGLGRSVTDAGLLDLLRHAVGRAQHAIQSGAEALGVLTQDLASTLVVAVATKDFIAVASIGDCTCVVREADGRATTVAAPAKGEYANASYFLGFPDEEMLVSKVHRAGIQDIAIFSDGLEGIALVRGEPFLPFLEPLWSADLADNDLKALLDSERVRRVTDDDCTLVIASSEGWSG